MVTSAEKGMSMALFEDWSLGSITSTTLLGLGLVVAAPLLLPVVGAVVRPVVRLAVMGGVAAYDAAAAMVTTAGAELNHMVADARAVAPEANDVAPPRIRRRGASA
jgi:hypothetical protein